MSLFITSLNSGSNGNCYYIGNDTEAVLVDVGISCRETERRMERLGLRMEKVKAVFISHEHTDHISGVPMLSKKYRLPVYITNSTLASSGMKLQPGLASSFTADQSVTIGRLQVTPFIKSHDASDPHSFIVAFDDIKVGVFTDIGHHCAKVIQYFGQCHAAFLETNYDDDMLQNGSYPSFLKKRISSKLGHLSNTQALDLFRRYRPGFMSHLLLSHLSKDNNRPELVSELFTRYADSTTIVVASRYGETPVYRISKDFKPAPLPVHPGEMQLSLF